MSKQPTSHRLHVLVPSTLEMRIRGAAQRRRLSKGAWVRRTIERALAEPDVDRDPLEQLGRLQAPTCAIGKMLAEIEAGRR